MNNVKNIKRFVDTYSFSYVDDAEFESKHKRDKNGQFAKTAEGKQQRREVNAQNRMKVVSLDNVVVGEKILETLPDVTNPEVLHAIDVYTQDTSENAPFKIINRSLRKTGKYPKEYEKECLALERGFSESSTSAPILLKRGTTVGYISKYLVDGKYSEPNFISSSISTDRAKAFALHNAQKPERPSQPAILMLYLESGKSALKIDKKGKNPDEQEILLSPNTKGELRYKIEEDGFAYYHIEVFK